MIQSSELLLVTITDPLPPVPTHGQPGPINSIQHTSYTNNTHIISILVTHRHPVILTANNATWCPLIFNQHTTNIVCNNSPLNFFNIGKDLRFTTTKQRVGVGGSRGILKNSVFLLLFVSFSALSSFKLCSSSPQRRAPSAGAAAKY